VEPVEALFAWIGFVPPGATGAPGPLLAVPRARILWSRDVVPYQPLAEEALFDGLAHLHPLMVVTLGLASVHVKQELAAQLFTKRSRQQRCEVAGSFAAFYASYQVPNEYADCLSPPGAEFTFHVLKGVTLNFTFCAYTPDVDDLRQWLVVAPGRAMLAAGRHQEWIDLECKFREWIATLRPLGPDARQWTGALGEALE
jgi:hypothetical protein